MSELYTASNHGTSLLVVSAVLSSAAVGAGCDLVCAAIIASKTLSFCTPK